MRRSEPCARTGFDVHGVASLTAALTLFAVAATSWTDTSWTLLAVSGVCVVAFVFAERRAESPLLELSIVSSPLVLSRLGANAVVACVLMATLVVGPFHLAHAIGLDGAPLGFSMAAGPAVAALIGFPAGLMVDRFPANQTTVGGLALVALGCGMIGALSSSSHAWSYLVPVVVMTAGYGLFQASNNTSTIAHAGPNSRGATAAALNLSRHLGLVVGSSAMGSVFAAGLGEAEIRAASHAAVASGTRLTFFVGSGLVVVAAVAFVASGPRLRR